MATLAHNLSTNLTQLRMARGLTQAQLADSAGIPRSTVTHMESGAGNPSLSNLARVAAALQVGIEALLAMPPNNLLHLPAARLTTRERAGGKASITDLLPEPLVGFSLERLTIKRAASLRRRSGSAGAQIYCHLLQGEVVVSASGEMVSLAAGDVLTFRADQPHSFRASGASTALLICATLPAPVASA